MQCLGFRVQDSRTRVQDSGFRIQGNRAVDRSRGAEPPDDPDLFERFRVQGLGFMV